MRLVEGAGDKHRNQTIDILFNSVAAHARARGIGVVLSGSLSDGSQGVAAIAHAGGMSMVLTRQGIAEPGMPENAVAYDGRIDVLGSAATIARESSCASERCLMRATRVRWCAVRAEEDGTPERESHRPPHRHLHDRAGAGGIKTGELFGRISARTNFPAFFNRIGPRRHIRTSIPKRQP